MTEIVFLRHFETEVDPETPVQDWKLTEDGNTAMEALLDDPLLASLDAVYTSPEHKARITASAIADRQDIPLIICEVLTEVDRSREGFIEDHDEYIRMVEQYLRNDTVPFDWEDRSTVENRVVSFLEQIDTDYQRIMAVTHGMYLATIIPKLRETDPVTFWHDLGFGELIRTDTAAIRDAIC